MDSNSSTVKKAESPQGKLSPMEKWHASRMKFLAEEKLKMSNEKPCELKASPTPAEQTTNVCTEGHQLNKTMQCRIGGCGYGFYDLTDVKEVLTEVIKREKENLECLLDDDETKDDARKEIMAEIESRNIQLNGNLNNKMDDYIEDEQRHISFLEGQLKNVEEMETSYNEFKPVFHRFGEWFL